MKNKKVFLSLGVLALTAVVSIPFITAKKKINLVFAEELPDINDSVRMPSMTFYGNTSSQMAFTWNTTNYTDSDLQVVAKSIGDFADPSVLNFRGTIEKSKVLDDGYIHRVVATELTPNTEYMYRVGDIELNTFAESGEFKTTSNTNRDFKFVHISDPQGHNAQHYEQYHSLLEQTATVEPEFYALTGDIVDYSWIDYSPTLQQWEWALTDQWNIFKNTPVMPVAGNHEEANYDFHSRFTLDHPAGSDYMSGEYYSVDYEGIHFTCINTNDSSGRKSAETAAGLSDEQMTWIRSDLNSHKDDRFKIVLMHKGIFDSGAHCANVDGNDYDIAIIRNQLAPLFTMYGVDLVLQGHDHLYSLSYPVVANEQGHKIDPTYTMKEVDYNGQSIRTFYNLNGTFYLNSGTSSGSKYYVPAGQETTYHIMETENPSSPMFSEVEVKDMVLVVKTYTLVNGIKSLIHSFAIDKNPYTPEPTPEPEPDPDTKIRTGCNGNIMVCSSTISLLSLVGVSLILFRRKKKN